MNVPQEYKQFFFSADAAAAAAAAAALSDLAPLTI